MEPKWCPLAPMVTMAGGGQVPLTSRLTPGASFQPTGPPRPLVTMSTGPLSSLAGMAWPGPLRPRRQGCQEPDGAGGGPAASRENEKNATFVSCSRLALAAREGGQRRPCARPRPQGIFERCSWGPGGWQTWQRQGAGPLTPPPRRRGLTQKGKQEEADTSHHLW